MGGDRLRENDPVPRPVPRFTCFPFMEEETGFRVGTDLKKARHRPTRSVSLDYTSGGGEVSGSDQVAVVSHLRGAGEQGRYLPGAGGLGDFVYFLRESIFLLRLFTLAVW